MIDRYNVDDAGYDVDKDGDWCMAIEVEGLEEEIEALKSGINECKANSKSVQANS